MHAPPAVTVYEFYTILTKTAITGEMQVFKIFFFFNYEKTFDELRSRLLLSVTLAINQLNAQILVL